MALRKRAGLHAFTKRTADATFDNSSNGRRRRMFAWRACVKWITLWIAIHCFILFCLGVAQRVIAASFSALSWFLQPNQKGPASQLGALLWASFFFLVVQALIKAKQTLRKEAFLHSAKEGEQAFNAGDVCSICLDGESDKDRVLACRHAFHDDCIRRWLDYSLARGLACSCPLCRVG